MRKVLVTSAVAVAAPLIAASTIAAPVTSTLVDAAEAGDRATALRLLAEKGSNPNAVGADGTTAIMWAAHNDDLALVQALIKAGANVKTQNQFGTSAIT